MFNHRDKVIAHYVLQHCLASEDQISSATPEVERRGPGSLLNVLVDKGIINPRQMITVVNAVQLSLDSKSPTSHKSPRLSKITKRPLPDFGDEKPTRGTRKLGALRPVTGPDPFTQKPAPASQRKLSRPTSTLRSDVLTMMPMQPAISISPTQGRDSPVPQLGFLAITFLKETTGALDRLEKAIQNDKSIPRANRMSIVTYVNQARVAFEKIQKRIN